MNHFSKEAEQSVVGGLMLSSLAFAIVEPLLNIDDFYYHEHKEIFSACIELDKSNMAMDIVTVAEYLEDKKSLVELSYLAELCDMTPSTTNVATYSNIVKEKSQRRQLHLMMITANDLMRDGVSAQETIDYISSEQLRISEGKQEVNQSILGSAVKDALNALDDRFNGRGNDFYTTGLTELDNIIQPEGGDLVIIAGRPSMGKSTLAQNIIEHNASKGVPCYLATMEMSSKQIANKMIASHGGVNLGCFKDPKKNIRDSDWSKITVGVKNTKDLPILIDYCPGLRLSDFKNRTRSWLRKQPEFTESGRGVLVVDHLGLMYTEGKNDVQELGEITKDLKNFAAELNIPIILVVQLNRSLESRPDKRPMMSDLRGSGKIEEDGSIIIMTYRDEKYNEDTLDKGIGELIVTKNREGELRTARVAAELQYARFTNLAQNYYSQDD